MSNNGFSIRMTDKRLRTYLPRDLCEHYQITPHSVLRISGEDGRIIIEPGKVVGVRDYTPAENLAYAKACVLAMNAEDLAEMRDVVTEKALELAGTSVKSNRNNNAR